MPKQKKEKKIVEFPKPRGYREFTGKPSKSGFFKNLGSLVVGLGVSASFLVAGVAFYQSQVLYPSQLKVSEERTGRYALSKYLGYLHDYADKALSETTGSRYLSSEVKLQNKNEFREKFVKTVLGTIKYKPQKVEALNKYGSVYYERCTKSTIKEPSLVNYGEKVYFTYIDYTKLKFDAKEVNELMEEAKIKQTDKDFVDKVTDLFALYISNRGTSGLPTKTIKRKVDLESTESGFRVTSNEDVYLDELLFSSKEFRDALDRFSLLALQGTETESKEYKEWSSKPKEEQSNFKEPYKWEKFRFIRYDWVGFYSLIRDLKVKPEKYVFPNGEGTKEKPAGLNTPVTTIAFAKNSKGEEVQIPIRVTLLQVSYGSDAIKDIMKANIRNRGLDPKSDNKYIYTKWKVENLSNEKFDIVANSALVDGEGNVSARTGTMYGLLDTATLERYQVVELQDWYASTELREKYLVWGKDFNKRVKPVWFKALKGSDTKVVIPSESIQTKDISANTNDKGTENVD